MPPNVSIVTLTHNKAAVTRRCLPTLLKTAPCITWELVVVDNGSTDETVPWLKQFQTELAQHPIKMKLIVNNGNVGCSTARNQGIEAAEGAFIAFIDNDVAVRSVHWLKKLKTVFHVQADCGVVGPKMLYPTPPFNIQCAGVGISRNGRVQFRGRGDPRETPSLSSRENIQTLISACFMVRRKLLEQYGGFDEAFNPVEFEDFDLCYRLRENGWQAVYEPAVEMYHLESVTTQGTTGIHNPALVIRNGLTFKKRWAHMFSKENGPDHSLTHWKNIPATQWDALGEMPTIKE